MKYGRADLHVHTRFSYDGLSTVEEVVDFAEFETDLDILAITDHNKITGALKARDYAKRQGYRIKIVIGEEIITSAGEVIALFIDKQIPAHMSLKKTLKAIHLQKGLAVIPHPFYRINFNVLGSRLGFKLNLGLGGMNMRPIAKMLLSQDPTLAIHALETMNSSWHGRIPHRKVNRVNNRSTRLAQLGSSDAHRADFIGTSYTLFPGESVNDLYNAILSRETIAKGEFWRNSDTVKLFAANLKKHGRKFNPKLSAKR